MRGGKGVEAREETRGSTKVSTSSLNEASEPPEHHSELSGDEQK